jgi:hypothetical protein
MLTAVTLWPRYHPVRRHSRGWMATDLATEQGGTDANEGDEMRQVGWLIVADLQL